MCRLPLQARLMTKKDQEGLVDGSQGVFWRAKGSPVMPGLDYPLAILLPLNLRPSRVMRKGSPEGFRAF